MDAWGSAAILLAMTKEGPASQCSIGFSLSSSTPRPLVAQPLLFTLRSVEGAVLLGSSSPLFLSVLRVSALSSSSFSSQATYAQ